MGNETTNKNKATKWVDELTGIYNREGFYHYTRELLNQHPDLKFCLIYCNIRKFKVINDLFGREIGDSVLVHQAEKFREALGAKIASFGRMESDNFVFCVQKSIVDDGKWLKLGDIDFTVGGADYHFFSYFGLYSIEDANLTISSMVDKARAALDKAKDSYVQPYAWFKEDMWDSMMEEQQLTSDFKRAIEERQFKVYYQPICATNDGSIIGTEALVRWDKPGKGLVPPNSFIPLFERNGYINELDRYVREEVCRMIRSRMDLGLEPLPVSVNVSRVEFYNPHLCEEIRDVARKYNVPSHLIRIELTETAYADNPKQVQDAVQKLHEYGFSVLMDDFGSGYSSLNILKDLPIDILKIDMRFMDDLEKSQKAAIILEAIVRMAKWMRIRVVAEGVETHKEWDYLRSVECDLVQGYYFHKPMEEKLYLELLDKIETKEVGPKKEVKTDLDGIILDVFKHGNSRESLLFHSMLGGMGVFEMTNDYLEVIQVNRGYYETIYGSSENLTDEIQVLNKPIKEPELSVLLKACRAARENGKLQQTQLHHLREDGSYVWLSVKIRYLGNYGKSALFYFALDNIDEIKEAEQERYLRSYSEALLKVFDKVYRLDYDTGMAEVLHTSSSDGMAVNEKYYFMDFFDRFMGSISWMENPNAGEIIRSKELLDAALEESKNGSFALSYRVEPGPSNVRAVSAMFFKVSAQDGKDEYLCCIKKKYYRKKEGTAE